MSFNSKLAEQLLRSEDVLGVYKDTMYQLHTTCIPKFPVLEKETGLWQGHIAQDLN